MVLVESHVIESQYLGIIKVLNNRKREKEGERARESGRCYELKLQLLWQYSQDHSPSLRPPQILLVVLITAIIVMNLNLNLILILVLRITVVHGYDSSHFEDHHDYDSSDSSRHGGSSFWSSCS